jgi:hypothetical protein
MDTMISKLKRHLAEYNKKLLERKIKNCSNAEREQHERIKDYLQKGHW